MMFADWATCYLPSSASRDFALPPIRATPRLALRAAPSPGNFARRGVGRAALDMPRRKEGAIPKVSSLVEKAWPEFPLEYAQKAIGITDGARARQDGHWKTVVCRRVRTT